MVTVHVLQGLPGSGKTTFVRRQCRAESTTICSADRFLVGDDGVYRFTPERVQAAHEHCLRAFVEALQTGASKHVVVDNTNLTVAEMAPYIALGRAYGAQIRIWHLDASPAVCRARQRHPVPADTWATMMQQLDEFSAPPWWPKRTAILLAANSGAEGICLGLALEPTQELVDLRASICGALDLRPRNFHITLAFLGAVGAPQLEALSDALLSHVEDDLEAVRFEGSGAACEPTGSAPVLLLPGELDLARGVPRLAWWTVVPSPSLVRLRAAAIAAATRLGLGEQHAAPFHPHVTLGSDVGAGRGARDPEFNVAWPAKEASLGALFCPSSVLASRLHFTASRVLPASFVCLRAW